ALHDIVVVEQLDVREQIGRAGARLHSIRECQHAPRSVTPATIDLGTMRQRARGAACSASRHHDDDHTYTPPWQIRGSMHRALLTLLLAAAALAPLAAPVRAQAVAPILGGTPSPTGKWPDAIALMFRNPQRHSLEADCTGVLIAPALALTAGHCADSSLESVIIGANLLSDAQTGETIAVARQIEYPSSQTSVDVALLVLVHPSTRPPRTIASGWARADIANGATVAIVGWGATNMTATQFPDAQQEATTTITDFDCSKSVGCNSAARPDGELGAGGMGV